MNRLSFLGIIIPVFLAASAAAIDFSATKLAGYEQNEVGDLNVTPDQNCIWPVVGGIDGVPQATDGNSVLKLMWTEDTDFSTEIHYHWNDFTFDFNDPELFVYVDVYVENESALASNIGLYDWDWPEYSRWIDTDFESLLRPGQWRSLPFYVGLINMNDLNNIDSLVFAELAGSSGTIYLDNLRVSRAVGDECHCARRVVFSGYTWCVLGSDWQMGAGPNFWTDDQNDIWVDANGLHLSIIKKDSDWFCSEVIAAENLSYGKYVYTINTNTDLLDPNIIVGLFIYDVCDPCGYHEIDVELTRWGKSDDNNNAQFVVQPWFHSGNLYRFPIAYSGPNEITTHEIKWSPTRVDFQSYYGDYTPNPPADSMINLWSYTGPDVPREASENPRINFYLANGAPPQNGLDANLIIKNFYYMPLGQTGRFGNFNDQKNIKLTLKDCGGNDVTFSLTGGGYGEIDPCDCNFGRIELFETTEKSKLTISTKRKTGSSVGSIICFGPLKAISAKNIDIHGDITIGSSPDAEAAVTIKFDQAKNLSIDSQIPIKSLTATEWLDTDEIQDKLKAPSIGSLKIKGNKTAGLAGDFEANLDVGTPGSETVVLVNLKIAGELTGESVIHGSMGTAKINVLKGRFDVERDVKSFKIRHNLTMLSYIKDAGELVIGGKAVITAGRDKIKVQKGAELFASQDANLYRLEDLRRYDQMGSWWNYNGNYCISTMGERQCDSANFTTRVENWTKQVHGHNCTVVTCDVGNTEISTAWYKDQTGIHQAGWATGGDLGFDLEIDSNAVAPEFVYLGRLYKSSGNLTGTFNMDVYGEEIYGDITGKINSTLKLAGHEEVITSEGVFLAAKVELSSVMKGKMNLEYEGDIYPAKFTISAKQTWWAVPQIGVVKINTKNLSIGISVTGEGIATVRMSETDDLTGYGP